MSNKIKKFDFGGTVGPFNPVAALGLTALNFALGDFFSKGKEATPMTPEEAERYAIEEGLATLLAQPTPGMAGGPEDIEGVGEQEVDLLQQAAELGNTDLINQITSLSPTETVRNIGTQVGEGIDTVFDILKLPNPTKGILGRQKGTLVWGQSGGSPVIGTGTTPGGTQTGVTTGDPTIDAVLNKVTGVFTGKAAAGDVLSRSTIEDILVGTAATETGMSTEQVRDIIESAKDIVPAPTAIGVDLGKEPKIGSSGVEQLDVTGDMGDLDTVVRGTPSSESLSLIETTTPKVPTIDTQDPTEPEVLTVGDLTPAAIPRTNVGTDEATPEPKTPAIAFTSESSGGGGGGGGGGFGTSSAGQRIVQTSPGELVDIDYLYDMAGSILPPINKEDEDIMPYIYNKGGPVQKFNNGGITAQDYFDATSGNQGSKGFGSKVMDFLGADKNQNLIGLIGGGLGGLLGMSGDTQSQGSLGYQGGIPDYTATRELVPNAFDNTGRRPGGAGRQYFTDVQYTPTSTTEGGLPAIIGAEQIAAQNAAYTEALAAQEADNIALANSFLGAIPTDTSTAATPVTPVTPPTAPSDTNLEGFIDLGEFVQNPGAYNFNKPVTPPTAPSDTNLEGFIDLGEFVQNPGAYNFNKPVTPPTDKSPMGPVNPFPSYEKQLRSGEKTPNQLAIDSGMKEEDLITRLINAGNTDVNEVLEYYSTLYPKLYGNTTVADVNKYLYPDQYAQGGDIDQYYLGGPTDGMADDIPAMIGNSQPAALSDGEFVIPADVVSHLGNGNSDAGAQNLYGMMERVRKDRTGNPNQGKQIDPNQYLA